MSCVTVYPGILHGEIPAIPSKSYVHRLMICASLSDNQTHIACPSVNEDMRATARCLSALTADISRDDSGYTVYPRAASPAPVLDCGESGSTFRFLVPVACALGVNAHFRLGGRLPQRPMSQLYSVLRRHGVEIQSEGTPEVTVSGRFTGGRCELPGNVSSQFISALIFSLPLTESGGEIVITSPLESRGYVNMTLDAVRKFGIDAKWSGDAICIPGGQRYASPLRVTAEGDWSGASCLMCAAAARGSDIAITGLNHESLQGDRVIADIISKFGDPPYGQDVNISDIPDLAPALALLGAAAKGTTRLTDAMRLKLKESDRGESIARALSDLGADIENGDGVITIRGGKKLRGGTTDSQNDHRIAMMAACAAVICEHPVTITDAGAVDKSYPGFYNDLKKLGLRVEWKEDHA